MNTDMLKILPAGLALAALLMVGGCSNSASPDNVDRRAVERWDYLIAHKAEQAYDYLTPGYRATQTRERYAQAMNNRPMQWKEAKFSSKECEADRCAVEVEVTYVVQLPTMRGSSPAVTTTRRETWLLVDGAWYLLPSD